MRPHLHKHFHGQHREFLSLRQTRDEVRPLLRLRFIDDILVVWPETGRGFPEFQDQLNAFHPSLKYTHEKSDTEINFLDLTIYKGTRFSEKQVLDLRPHLKNKKQIPVLALSVLSTRTHLQGLGPGRDDQNAACQQRSLDLCKVNRQNMTCPAGPRLSQTFA